MEFADVDMRIGGFRDLNEDDSDKDEEEEHEEDYETYPFDEIDVSFVFTGEPGAFTKDILII